MNMNMRMSGPEFGNPSERAPRTLYDVLNDIEGDNLDFLPDVDIPEIGRVSAVDAVGRGMYVEYLEALRGVKKQGVEKEHDAIDCLVSINEELKREKPDEKLIEIAVAHFQSLAR